MTKYTKATLHANGEKQEFATAEDAKRLRAAFKAAYFKSSDGTVEYGVTADASTFVVLTIDTTATPLAPKPNCDNYGECADCPPSVILVTGVTADPTEVTIEVGKSSKIALTLAPDNATDKTLDVSVSNTSVTTAAADGTITGVAVGSTDVIFVSKSNHEAKATVKVTVVDSTDNAPANNGK
ncbi:Ig-like domain-containing protein [Lactococcus lactis]|uniref:Ig-like domain-containing protein n=1 Tax=Lactococcus lactis TaxID=1358 RepID=UPI0013A55A46|nr:Ig-like domain-containing protein [Lactococcus lactis]